MEQQQKGFKVGACSVLSPYYLEQSTWGYLVGNVVTKEGKDKMLQCFVPRKDWIFV